MMTPTAKQREQVGRRVAAVATALAMMSGVLLIAGQARGQAPAAPSTLPAADAAAPSADLVAHGVDSDGKSLSIQVNRSSEIVTRTPFSRVNVGSPDIADVTAIGPTNLLVTAKKPGRTQLMIWDDQNRQQTIDVIVGYDIVGIRHALSAILPHEKIDVTDTNGSIVLQGNVSNLETAKQAEMLAKEFAGNFVNLLQVAGGQQVMLEVKVAEVSRSAINQLGVNFGLSDGVGFGGSNVGSITPYGVSAGTGAGTGILGVPSTSSAVTLFGGGTAGRTAFTVFLEALQQNSLLRVLAEPTLVTASGQKASFLAGGEFPIPISQPGSGGTAITIEYKDYGVQLNFTPVTLGDGNIRMLIEPEVSDLDYTNGVSIGGYTVPGVRTRRLSTTVEVGDGQSLALAGLMDDSTTTRKEAVPLLGDLPILGALFRSTRYERDETELVVLVTPHLVSPMNPDQTPPLPGQDWHRPTEAQLFINGDLGGDAKTPTIRPTTPPPVYRGQYGFTPGTTPTRSGT